MLSRQLYTPQYIQDEATGDLDRSKVNKYCSEQESSLFQKKKWSEALQAGHRKTLRLSSRSAPAQLNDSVILQ